MVIFKFTHVKKSNIRDQDFNLTFNVKLKLSVTINMLRINAK